MRGPGARRTIAAAAAVAVAWVVAPAPARAHGEYPETVRAVVERVAPPLPARVSIGVPATGPPRVTASNTGPGVLEALDERGRPFLRIGPGGVRADVASAAWYRSGNPDGIADLPAGVADAAPASWRRVSPRPAWTWFDRRLHPPVRLPAEGEALRLAGWQLGFRHDGRSVEVAGRIEYRPPAGAVTAAFDQPTGGLPGARAAVLAGAVPALYLELAGAREALVLGADGEPFARLARDGAWINTRSPLAAADAEIRGRPRPPAPVDPGAAPRWRRAGDAPRLAWFDPRVREGPPPEAVMRGRRPVELRRFEVPVDIAGRRGALTGTIRWAPAADAAAPSGAGASAPAARGAVAPGALAAALLAAGAVATVAARRRRARQRVAGG